MNNIIIEIVALVVGVIIGWVLKSAVIYLSGKEKKKTLIEKQAEEKKNNKEAILGLMETGNQPLTNNHVEQMLGIPESTVTRYFDELEKEGKVRQVGVTGRDVFYELNK